MNPKVLHWVPYTHQVYDTYTGTNPENLNPCFQWFSSVVFFQMFSDSTSTDDVTSTDAEPFAI